MTESGNLPVNAGAEGPAVSNAAAKPRAKLSAGLTRFNDCIVSALGAEQRDWVLSVQGLDTVPESDADTERGRRAGRRLEHQNQRRQANLDAILFHAFARLPSSVDDGAIDPDWAARFFELAADCSDPERQALWARLLIMEVRRPGAVPAVAAAVLATLSPRMVDWVRAIAGLTINNFFVRISDAFNAERGLVGDVILLLEEYGLLRSNKDPTKVFRSQLEAKFSTNLLYNDKILRVLHDDPNKELVIPCYRLSDAGAALCNAVLQEENVDADMEYIVEIIKLVQKQGCTVMQAEILARASDNVVAKHSAFCEIVALHQKRVG